MVKPTAAAGLLLLLAPMLVSCGAGPAVTGGAGSLDGTWKGGAWRGGAVVALNPLAPPGGRPYEYGVSVVSQRDGASGAERRDVVQFALPETAAVGAFELGRGQAVVATVVGGDARVDEYRSVGAVGDGGRITVSAAGRVEGTVAFRAVRASGSPADTAVFEGRFEAVRGRSR